MDTLAPQLPLLHRFAPSSPHDTLAATIYLNALDHHHQSSHPFQTACANDLSRAWQSALPPHVSPAAYRRQLVVDWGLNPARIDQGSYARSDEWRAASSYLDEITALRQEVARLGRGWDEEKRRWEARMIQTAEEDEDEEIADEFMGSEQELKRLRKENRALAREATFFQDEYNTAYATLHSQPPSLPSHPQPDEWLQKRVQGLEAANIQMAQILASSEAERKASFQRKALVERLERARKRQRRVSPSRRGGGEEKGTKSGGAGRTMLELLDTGDAATYIMHLTEQLRRAEGERDVLARENEEIRSLQQAQLGGG